MFKKIFATFILLLIACSVVPNTGTFNTRACVTDSACLAPRFTARDKFESTLARFAKMGQEPELAKSKTVVDLEGDLAKLHINFSQIKNGMVGKIKYSDWIGKRPALVQMIFNATSDPVVPMDSYERRSRARMYTDLIRSRPLSEIKALLKTYIDKYLDGKESSYALSVLYALRKKHQNMARHDYLVKKKHKRRNPALSPANEEEQQFLNSFKQLLYRAVNASYYAKFRKYNRVHDIYNVPFWDLPLWVVDENGHIDNALMKDWIGLSTKLPDSTWRGLLKDGKLQSLAQVSGLEVPPEASQAANTPVQLSLFDLPVYYSTDLEKSA